MKELFRTYPLALIGTTVLVIVEGAVGAMSAFAIAPVVDLFLNHGNLPNTLMSRTITTVLHSVGLPVSLRSCLAVAVGLLMLKNVIAITARYVIIRTKYAVVRDIMLGLFKDVFQARWGFFSSQKQGTLVNTFIREVHAIGEVFQAVALFVAAFLQLICFLLIPLYLSWQMTALSLVTALVCAVPFLLMGKLHYRLGSINVQTANDMSWVIQGSLGLAKVILGFANQPKSVAYLKEALDVHRRTTVKFQTLRFATPKLYQPFGLLIVAVALLSAQQSRMSPAEIAVFVWALFNAFPLIGELLAQKNALVHSLPGYQQIQSLRSQAVAWVQRSGSRRFPGLRREIALERLTFAYPGHPPTLIDLTLRIPKGKMIAVVGESGAGKTTLIDLLMGFHEPTEGQVVCDGVPLEEFDIVSYRQRVGYVPQESVLFNLSIRDNLRWARDDATDEEIREACRLANASEFIERFTDGYDTLVGDRGVRLSGGQCQRIALARALLRKPEVLILDEATSSLDAPSERLIQEAIETVAKDTTVVVIAHRLSTIVNADHIYVLHNGRLVEEGTYHDLAQKEGHFSRMTNLQFLESAV